MRMGVGGMARLLDADGELEGHVVRSFMQYRAPNQLNTFAPTAIVFALS